MKFTFEFKESQNILKGRKKKKRMKKDFPLDLPHVTISALAGRSDFIGGPGLGLASSSPLSPQELRLKVDTNRYSATLYFPATLKIVDQMV